MINKGGQVVITPEQEEHYRRRLASDLPLLGRWLRRRTARRLGDAAIQSGSTSATGLLVDVLTGEIAAGRGDAVLQAICRDVLKRLTFSATIDVFCRAWLERRHPACESILLERGYVAEQPLECKVLTALKTGRLEVIRAMGGGCVPPLIKAMSDEDSVVAANAVDVLGSLSQPAAVDALCRHVMDNPAPDLNAIAAASGYAPKDEARRALYFFLTEQWAAYEALDFQAGRPLLKRAVLRGPELYRQRFLDVARRTGRSALVSEVLVDGGRQKKAADMTFQDWADIAAGLSEDHQADALWRFLWIGPAAFAPGILAHLARAEWRPSAKDADAFGRLLQLCPEDTKVMPLVEGAPQKTHPTHIDQIEPLLTAPRQKLLLGGCASTIRLWDFESGGHVTTLQGHDWTVTDLLVTPDERMLVSSSKDRTIRFWTLPSGKPVKVLQGHRDWITCLAMTPDGRWLVSGSRDSTVRLWGLPGGNAVKTMTLEALKQAVSWVLCLCVHPAGGMVAAGSRDSTVRLWRIPEGEHLKTMEGHRGGVQCLTATDDGHVLVSGGKAGAMKFWDFEGGRLIKTEHMHDGAVLCFAKLGQGNILASAGKDGAIQLWDLPEGTHRQALAHHKGSVLALAASPDGEVLVSASSDGTIAVWRVRDGRLIASLTGHAGQVRSIAISPDTRMLASGSSDNTLKFWRLSMAKPMAAATHNDLKRVQQVIAAGHRDAVSLRHWRLLEALLQAKFRFDIGLEARVISLGAYDIEIESE